MPTSRIGKGTRKKEIWKKSNGLCAHCGYLTAPEQQTVDHGIPHSHGGGFDKRNLMPLCKKCNRSRGDRVVNPWEFYPYASPEAIQEFLEYKREWLESHRNANGDIIR